MKRVLVVDDDRIQHRIVSRILSSAGVAVDCASDLSAARAYLLQHEYEALILDLSLRGESGIEVLHFAVEAGQKPRIVFISVLDQRIRMASSQVARQLGLPVCGTLSKPFTVAELMELLQAPIPTLQGECQPQAVQPTGHDLAVALGSGEVFVQFQPQIELATGALAGFEALARWSSPTLGVVGPDIFIPLAEETGLIDQLTDFVLQQALAACADLRAKGITTTAAVNLSPLCLKDDHLADRIDTLLRGFNLPASSLTLELTETYEATEASAIEQLTKFRIRNIGLSMDDFGTGHSTLLSLLRLPFSELKIDKSFVLLLGIDPEAEKIVRATVAMARELGLRTVAEGVETQAIATALAGMQCNVGQGWYFGRPGTAADLIERYGSAALLS